MKSNRHPNTGLIQHPDEAEDLFSRFESGDVIALDTEFLRISTYFPRLCLVQLKTDNTTAACLDPLALGNDFLATHLKKLDGPFVLHSAGQDLEVLSTALNFAPEPMFDTQIGAAFLGGNDQQGYASLVEEHTGIRLPKAHTRTDWCKRPLSQGQLEYAALDVEYLIEICSTQRAALQAQGKLDWAEEEIKRRCDSFRDQDDLEPVQRFRGGAELPLESQQILKLLILWRENEARRRNLPREWIVANSDLIAASLKRPGTLRALQQCTDMKPGEYRRSSEAMLAIINPDTPGFSGDPVWPRLEPLDNQQKKQLKSLQADIRRIAEDRQISPSVIANRKNLESVVRGNPAALQNGWRGEICHEVISSFIK